MELVNITRPGSQEQVFLVMRGGAKAGLISKFKPQAGYQHPWKAFKLDGAAKMQPNTMIEVFYGAGAKNKAIKAVLGAA